MKNVNRYVRADGERFLKDTRNEYMMVDQRPYPGKIAEDGKVLIPSGAKAKLLILHDDGGVVDRNTGEIRDNELETIEVTIVGVDYPLPFEKKSKVRLEGFMPEISFVVGYDLILRFSGIEKL